LAKLQEAIMRIRSVFFGLIVLILVLVMTGIVNAAKAKTAKKKAVTVNMDAKKLPKKFVGENEEIIRIMNASYLEKSEYETNEAYQQRKKASENKVYVFSRESNEYEHETFYDAEEKALIVTISSRMSKYIGGHFNDLKKSYIGQNAFGAKAQVRTGTIYSYDLKIPMPECKINFKMDPEQAEIFRENIRMLYWVNILGVERSSSYREATIDIPIDGAVVFFKGKSKLIEMWLYNFETGEIYKKLNPDGKPINF
jgi:hypothetical protein